MTFNSPFSYLDYSVMRHVNYEFEVSYEFLKSHSTRPSELPRFISRLLTSTVHTSPTSSVYSVFFNLWTLFARSSVRVDALGWWPPPMWTIVDCVKIAEAVLDMFTIACVQNMRVVTFTYEWSATTDLLNKQTK